MVYGGSIQEARPWSADQFAFGQLDWSADVTSLRLDNWSADQFAFGQLVRGPVCVWLTGPQTSLMIQL